MVRTSAGLLMYRRREGGPEVLLAHPGGPFWKNKDEGVWSIPKGEVEDHETDLLEVAKREFREETGVEPIGTFQSLGTVKRKDGKEVHGWAFESDCDTSTITSNTISIEWPPRSGKQMEIPEVDRAEFFGLEEAKRKINSYQVGLIEAFEKLL